MFTVLKFALLLTALFLEVQGYRVRRGEGEGSDIPEASLEFLSPKGLTISIPDWDEDVTLVAFHVSVNEEFYGVEAGQFAADLHKKKNGRWSLTIPQLRARSGDTVYYWVYAIRDGVGIQSLDHSVQLP